MLEKVRSFATAITLFIAIIEDFCNVEWSEDIYPHSFTQIGTASRFVNPYRHRITIYPCDGIDSPSEGSENNCESDIPSPTSRKACSCPLARSSCNMLFSGGVKLNGYIKCLSCFCGFRSSNSSTSSSHTKCSPNFPSICKCYSNKNFKGCKNCTHCEIDQENSDEIEDEVVSLNKFNDSSEITSEIDSSETTCPETIVNKTSFPSKATIPYDVYLKILDNYPLFSIKRASYIRMKQIFYKNKQLLLSEISRDPENSVDSNKKLFISREQYLGLTTNHINKGNSTIEFTKSSFRHSKDSDYKGEKPMFQNSSANGSINWKEWEHIHKKVGISALRDKLGELSNEIMGLSPNITSNKTDAPNNQDFSPRSNHTPSSD